MKNVINVLCKNKKKTIVFGILFVATIDLIHQLITGNLDTESTIFNFMSLGIGIISYQISKSTKIRIICAFLLILIWQVVQSLLDKSFVDLSTLFLLALFSLFFTGMLGLIFYSIDN